MKLILDKIKYLLFSSFVLFSLPFSVFSQFQGGVTACDTSDFSLLGSNFKCTIIRVIELINLLIPVLFGSAFIVFFWGLSKFILNSGSSTEIENGKKYMLWGGVALFVMVSIRAIIGLIVGNLEIGDIEDIPLLETNAS